MPHEAAARGLLRGGAAPYRPPYHAQGAAVCTVRQAVRAAAAAEQGGFGSVAAADDLEALAREGRGAAVRLEGGAPAPGAPAWAALLAGMELGEAARFRGPRGLDADSVLLLELRGWIEETRLPGARGAGATLYMERSAGVNDAAVAEDAAALPGPLAKVTLWYRAERGGETLESAADGQELVVDEDWPGEAAAALPAELHGPLDVAARCMRPAEAAELITASGWHVLLRLLSASNPKPAYDMDPAEKLEAAHAWRERGNASYSVKDWERALNCYVLAAAAVVHADRDSNFTEEERAAARSERLLVSLNVAATALQLGDGEEALRQSEDALSIDPSSFKGLWRRGKARLVLGDPEHALEDLQSAVRLVATPHQRRQVQQEISRANADVKRRAAAQHEEFGGMFAKAPGFLSDADVTVEPAAAVDGAPRAYPSPAFGLEADFVSDDPDVAVPRFAT